MSLKGVAIAGMVAVLYLPGAALADGDSDAGRKKAETCLGCHGIEDYKNAYPTFPVPKLGGQNAQYIIDALKGYANGDRPHGTMHAQAATLSEQDMADIAAWFEAAE
jgi:cytochrome c553